MSTTSFPPHHSRPSRPISPSLALHHLTTYLTAATTTPSLLPTATLQPTGPIAPSDAASNLTIQHLQRVEAGLRGEWLAPTLDLEESGAAGGVAEGAEGGGKEGDVEMGTDGWQDLNEYQREQSVEVGELGGETTVLAGEGGVEVKATDEAGQKQDKEARKRDKKEKEKALKREKAEKARKGASA
ncbi:hypothetical protein VE03_00087 [Pseudogymnoascus sp. 23342-1-I1]|nr:hypothetical protein VE03_00087 [Pseudogymnoascus sp. 23342-1-I1]